jgi:hypothetical protein
MKRVLRLRRINSRKNDAHWWPPIVFSEPTGYLGGSHSKRAFVSLLETKERDKVLPGASYTVLGS